MDNVTLQSCHCDFSRQTDKSFKILKNIGEVAYHFPFEEPILLVGCGDGFELDVFNLLGFKDIKGIDIDNEKIAIAKSFGCNVECVSIEDYIPNKPRNVYCAHTLEHCKNLNEVVKKLEKITLNTLCIIVPIEKKKTKNPSHLSPIKSLVDITINTEDFKIVRMYENLNYELQGILVVRRV